MNKHKFKWKLISSLFIIQLITFTIAYSISTLPTPTSLKYLNDYVGLINEPEKGNILGIGKELEDKTGAQGVIVVVDSLNGDAVENYALNLFRSWGIGQKGKDNGFLILLAINEKTWRVEVGRGVEGIIPDALSNRVMEDLAKPSFIEGNYSQGLLNSYSTFCDLVAEENGVTLNKSLHITLPNYNTNNNPSSFPGGGILGGIIAILFLLDIIFNRGRISSTMLQLIFWSNIGRHNGPRGGSGGGFGGFGGGSSNGGGSSGRW